MRFSPASRWIRRIPGAALDVAVHDEEALLRILQVEAVQGARVVCRQQHLAVALGSIDEHLDDAGAQLGVERGVDVVDGEEFSGVCAS